MASLTPLIYWEQRHKCGKQHFWFTPCILFTVQCWAKTGSLFCQTLKTPTSVALQKILHAKSWYPSCVSSVPCVSYPAPISQLKCGICFCFCIYICTYLYLYSFLYFSVFVFEPYCWSHAFHCAVKPISYPAQFLILIVVKCQQGAAKKSRRLQHMGVPWWDNLPSHQASFHIALETWYM